MDVNQLAQTALEIILPVLAALAVEYIRRAMGTEKMKKVQEELATKQDLAATAVQFAQQAYGDLGGPERYEKAAQWLSDVAVKQGIKLSSDEIQGLIESAVLVAKDAFSEEWQKAVMAPTVGSQTS